MQPAQIFALSVSLFHVGLLGGVYISTGGAPAEIFVSAMLDSHTYFKVLLSAVVALEVAVAAVYIFQSRPPLSTPWASLAGLSLVTAFFSWITVVSTTMGEPWHFRGTAIFVISSSVYSCFLIARAPRYKCLYASILVADISCAAGFVALHLQQDYGTSSVVEWVTFLLQGTMFAIYYFETPIVSGENDHTGQKSTLRTVVATQQQRRQAGAARPLLVVVRGSSFSSSSSSQQLVAAATPLIGGGAGAKGIRSLGAVAEEEYDEDEEQGPWGSRW
jgi:hypothetical protein